MSSILEVRDLTVTYQTGRAHTHQAVDGVSFNLASGEVLGVMGQSGCGKSSIALALLGLLQGQNVHISGSVILDGEDLLRADERRLQRLRGSKISLVFQEPGIALSPVMRVGDQIAEVIHAHTDHSWRLCHAQAEEFLTQVGFTETQRIFSAYPHQLSGGQKQRIVLAQALCCQPAVLIADEPTASLDARSQADILAVLRDLKDRLNISILLVSHSPEVQASLANRLMVMEGGRIIEEGRLDELYWNAQQEQTRLMLRHAQRPRAASYNERERALQEQLTR